MTGKYTDYLAQAEFCKRMAGMANTAAKKALWHTLATKWQAIADESVDDDVRSQVEWALGLKRAPEQPSPMNEQQLKERVQELRRIAAKMQNAEDRKNLLKLASDFEACANRLLKLSGYW